VRTSVEPPPPAPSSTGNDRASDGSHLVGGPPAMAEPPVTEPEPEQAPALAPLPGLRPKGALPSDLPAMPAPPPSPKTDGADSPD